MLGVNVSGSFDKIENALKLLQSDTLFADLQQYGQKGVDALASATPIDTGKTAASWDYRITRTRTRTSIEWFNTNGDVAVMLQYGHGTGTGGYVPGKDYINPAIKPVFDEISIDFWRRVTQ